VLPEAFTVVTWNVWHGLDAGEFWVAPTETPEENQARLQHQVVQLAAVRPDVIFLQEVNPLPQRALAFVEGLKAQGLSYRQVHQVDACGIRRRGGPGLIPDLNNGLVILAKEELQLEKLEGLKLSGDVGGCESTSGYQFEELRYALIGEITLPGTDVKYLVVSLHLHSGLEAGSPFLNQVGILHKQGQFSHYPKLQWTIDQSRLRRIGELDVLMRDLYRRSRVTPYAGIVIGGDFNFEPDFPEYEEALMLRLQDSHTSATHMDDIYTVDPSRNARNAPRESIEIPNNLAHNLDGESQKTQEVVRAAYQAEMIRPRRIDYLFVNEFFPDHCLRQDLFGTDNNAGVPASDHFGIMNRYTRARSTCGRAASPANPSSSRAPSAH
jgi:endonuclease/exonuclease/phosphatase family metal-dependent hydrolase